MRVFLDTNIFLYAAGRSHPLRDTCAKVLLRVADGSLAATINSEVVQEVLYVLIRRGQRREGLTLARHLISLFPDLLPVTGEDMTEACGLLQQYPRLSVRDAVLIASMLRNGINTVVSVDRDFDQISQIHRLAPAAL